MNIRVAFIFYYPGEGGGGRALNEVLYSEAVPRCPVPLTLLYTSYPFCIPSTDR